MVNPFKFERAVLALISAAAVMCQEIICAGTVSSIHVYVLDT